MATTVFWIYEGEVWSADTWSGRDQRRRREKKGLHLRNTAGFSHGARSLCLLPIDLPTASQGRNVPIVQVRQLRLRD